MGMVISRFWGTKAARSRVLRVRVVPLLLTRQRSRGYIARCFGAPKRKGDTRSFSRRGGKGHETARLDRAYALLRINYELGSVQGQDWLWSMIQDWL